MGIRGVAHRPVAVITACAFALSSCAGSCGRGRAGTTQAPTTVVAAPIPYAREIAEAPTPVAAVEAVYGVLDRASQEVAREGIEIEALARQLGTPNSAVAFVSTRIRYEHYDGVLRGAEGTLVSGAGSSCDQSILLRELLAHYRVRATVHVAGVTPDMNLALRLRALSEGLPRVKPQGVTLGSLSGAVTSKLEQLEGIVGSTRIPPVLAAIVNYCWISAEIDGSRREIDTVLEHPPGSPHLSFTTGVPAALRHHFTIRVTLDRTSRSQQETIELLKTSVPVDALHHTPVVLTVRTETDDPWNQETAEGIRQALGNSTVFVPTVVISGEAHTGKGFTLQGGVVGPAPTLGIGSELGDRMAGMLGRTPAGEKPPGSDNRMSLTGVWMDCEVTQPNGTIEKYRRPLVEPDTLPADPAAAALQVIQDKQILVTGIRASADLLTLRLVEYFKNHRPVLDALASGTQAPDVPLPHYVQWQLFSLAYLQDHAATEIMFAADDGVLFRGRAGILIASSDLDITDGRLFDRVRLDVMSTGYEAVSDGGRDRRLRALLGIYTSFAEVLAIGGPDPASLLSLERRAKEQGISLIKLSAPQDLARWPQAGAGPQRKAMRDALEAGDHLVALDRTPSASSGPRFGWWRRDNKSGEWLAVLDNYEGGAQTATEYPLTKAFVKGAVVGAAYGLVKCKFEHGMSADCRRDMACKGLFGGVLALVVAIVAGWLTYMTIGADALGNPIWVLTTQVPSGSAFPTVLGGVGAAGEGLCKRITGDGKKGK